MVAPLVIGIGAAISALSTAFGLGLAVGDDNWGKFKKWIYAGIVEEALKRAGLELLEDDPLSDASFSQAVSKKLGFTIRTLKDKESLEGDILEEASRRIEAKTGVKFNNLKSRDQIVRDAIDFGVSKIAAESGLVLTDPLNADALKADVLAWGKEKVISEIGEDMVAALSAEWSNGVSLVQMMKQATGREVSPKELLSALNGVVMKSYAEKMDRFKGATKADRRRMQNRMNQRAFRDRHRKGSSGYDGYGVSSYIPLSSKGG